MSEEKKVGKFKWEEKKCVKEKGLIILGGVITIGAVAIGYTLGSKITATKLELGLERCFKHDPTLETHLRKVLNEVTSEMKRK